MAWSSGAALERSAMREEVTPMPLPRELVGQVGSVWAWRGGRRDGTGRGRGRGNTDPMARPREIPMVLWLMVPEKRKTGREPSRRRA